ncbi:MAG: hypothetical protein B7X00_01355, partial [Legionella sp. 21-45-4]
MTTKPVDIRHVIQDIGALIARNEDPATHYYTYFVQEPELCNPILDFLITLPDNDDETERTLYSASIFAIDICISHLQTAEENGNKYAARFMQQVMTHLT